MQLLADTGFTTTKPVQIPMDPTVLINDTDGEPLPDVSLYRRLIGRLVYLTISRPDIAFTVNRFSQFMAKPRTPHLQAIHHFLRYLKGSPGKGILFPFATNLKLSAYVDADWGTCTVTRKSTTWFCVFLGKSLIA